MTFLRRFLGPVVLSSWLIAIAIGLFSGLSPSSALSNSLGDWTIPIGFVGFFVAMGLFLVGYPTAYFLAQKGASFPIALPLLLAAGAFGGGAIAFLVSMLTTGHAFGNGANWPTTLLGSLFGTITAFVWTILNADLFPRVPQENSDA